LRARQRAAFPNNAVALPLCLTNALALAIF
jgi:hypothetical protein